VILTHQDIDHIGSARLLRDAGAQIMAHEIEAPAIQGADPLIKIADMEAHLDELPEPQKAFYHQLKDAMPNLIVPVDVLLTDGQELPICGGITVIHTPGHTPGHISLLLSESNIAVCGDAANINEGKLVGANPGMTHDMAIATESFKKLAALDVAGYVCYHTGYLAK
ncbi:MAG: MBL fold metallo-hydrolase, partial [Coriobacteriia bacterium]|nr:MBL fold metallo-hydrolase [Coriobacteriia bacterium]